MKIFRECILGIVIFVGSLHSQGLNSVLINAVYSWWVVENVEITDTSQMVAYSSNISVDSRNRPHIVYMIVGSPDLLKYAYKDSNGWNIEVLDTVSVLGAFPALSLDRNDFPHIVYQKEWAGSYYLYYIYKDSSGWHKEERIDSVINPLGSWPMWISMEVDTLGNPHVVFSGTDGNFDYEYYAFKENNTWNFEPLFSPAYGCASLRLNREQLPRFSNFWDGMVLYYSHKEDTLWIHEPVDTNNPYASWWTTALALDSQDLPHIVYKDPHPDDYRLKYAHFNGDSWNIEVIDPMDPYVASRRAIVTDFYDNPHIVYNSGIDTIGNLEYVYWTGTNWDYIIADSGRGDTVTGIRGAAIDMDRNGIFHWITGAAIPGSSSGDGIRYGYGTPIKIEERIYVLPFNSSISIYPNPFSDRILLKFPSYLRNSIFDIDLYDVSGKLVFSLSKKFTGKKILLLDRKIPSGVYFLKIKKSNKILFKQKIIKLKSRHN